MDRCYAWIEPYGYSLQELDSAGHRWKKEAAFSANLGIILHPDSLYMEHHFLSLQGLECTRGVCGVQESAEVSSRQLGVPSGGDIVLVRWDWLLVPLLTTWVMRL